MQRIDSVVLAITHTVLLVIFRCSLGHKASTFSTLRLNPNPGKKRKEGAQLRLSVVVGDVVVFHLPSWTNKIKGSKIMLGTGKGSSH